METGPLSRALRTNGPLRKRQSNMTGFLKGKSSRNLVMWEQKENGHMGTYPEGSPLKSESGNSSGYNLLG